MAEVRYAPGVPTVASFAGLGAPTQCAPIVVDSDTGIGYTLKTGDVVYPAAAGGTVTSVAQTFTGGLISVAGSPITGSGTLALTVSGTSGGVPYFSGAAMWASSGVLTNHALMLGGGVAGAPSTPVGLGTATTVLHGNATGAPSWGAVSLTTDVSGTLQAAQAPAYSGDASSSAGSLTLTLATVASAGTNTKVTYNAKGLVTSGTPAVLASSDFANQGTATTVLHGNAAGNPSWGAVSLTTDVSGTLQASQFPALTGDVTTSGGSLATTLATVVSASTQTKITYNAKGLVTAGSQAAASDLSNGTTGSGSIVLSASPTLSGTLTIGSAFLYDGTFPSTLDSGLRITFRDVADNARLSAGASDSGGSGYRLVRIPN